MPSLKAKMLEFNYSQKSVKALIKTDGCKKNPEKSSKTKVSDHILSGFSVSRLSSFKIIYLKK